MVTSQILKFVDFIKIQKSRYLESKTLFLLQIKKIINYTLRAILWQKNNFVAEVTFNVESATNLIKQTYVQKTVFIRYFLDPWCHCKKVWSKYYRADFAIQKVMPSTVHLPITDMNY